MPGLRPDYPWHARCLPASHAARTRGPPVSHLWPTRGPNGPTRGPGVAQAWPRRRTGLVWAPPRRDVLTGGKDRARKSIYLKLILIKLVSL